VRALTRLRHFGTSLTPLVETSWFERRNASPVITKRQAVSNDLARRATGPVQSHPAFVSSLVAHPLVSSDQRRVRFGLRRSSSAEGSSEFGRFGASLRPCCDLEWNDTGAVRPGAGSIWSCVRAVGPEVHSTYWVCGSCPETACRACGLPHCVSRALWSAVLASPWAERFRTSSQSSNRRSCRRTSPPAVFCRGALARAHGRSRRREREHTTGRWRRLQRGGVGSAFRTT
jgi:hypothetical protein